jgi:hypothetical protein
MRPQRLFCDSSERGVGIGGVGASCPATLFIFFEGGKIHARPPNPEVILQGAKIPERDNGMATVEEVIEVVQDDVGTFRPDYIRETIEKYDLEVGEALETFIEKVREERIRWAVEATRSFFESLRLPLYSLTPLAAEALRKNGEVSAYWSTPEQELKINIGGEKPSRFSFTAPLDLTEERLGFSIWPDVVYFSARSGLTTLNKRPFFRSPNPEDTKKALSAVKTLHPFFSAIGLEDLESALQALASLQEGEARMEGPYVVARMGGTFALRKGLMLGDPHADGSLLTKGEAHVVFPGGVEFDLKTEVKLDADLHLETPFLKITQARIRVGDEEASFSDLGSARSIFFRNPILRALKGGFKEELRFHQGEVPPTVWDKFPPRVAALLIAFVKHEDPLAALASGKLHPYATAELFVNL